MIAGLRHGARRALLAILLVPGAAAPEDASPTPAFGEEIVVVGPRRSAADPTASVTTVEASRFAGEAKTVAELVSTAPGVAVNQYGGLGQLATVSIRGSTADQVRVLLDGLPLNTAAGGGVDLSRIPRQWIERIEIVRGAEGAYYGSGALGGVVNIVTRPAAAGTWSAEASGGAFRTLSGSLDAAVGDRRWALLGAGAVDDTGGRFGYLFDPQPSIQDNALDPRTRDHNASLTAGGLAKLWADAGDGRLDAVVQVSGGARDLPGSPYATTPRDGQSDLRLGTVVRFFQPVTDGVHLTLGATGQRDHLAVRIAPLPESLQDDLAGTLSAQFAWFAGPSALTLRTEVGTERLAVEGGERHTRGVFAITASEQLDVVPGRLRVAPAIRWERIGPFEDVSGKVGASMRLVGPLSLRASVGRSVRVPSFAELFLQQGLLAPNPALVPEQAWSADGALVADGALGLVSFGAFWTLYRDVIIYETDFSRRSKPFNDGKASVSGLEAEVASAPIGPPGFVVSAAYTFLSSETLRGGESVLGKSLPHRARHRAYARLGAGRGPYEAHGEMHWVSQQFQDLANSPALTVPPAVTFNLGGSLRLWRRPEVRLSLEIRNLLDDRTLQDGFGNPLPGRMALLTMRIAGGKDATTP